jgi:hypothetical protein
MLDTSKNTKFLLSILSWEINLSNGKVVAAQVHWTYFDVINPVFNWNVEPNQSQGSHICEAPAFSGTHQDFFTCQVPELFALLA